MLKKALSRVTYFSIPLLFMSTLFFSAPLVFAQDSTINELEANINQKNRERELLQAEAEKLREELEAISGTKKSISQELSVITGERKSLENQIAQTQNEIETLNLEINRAEHLIQNYTNKIDRNRSALGKVIRSIARQDNLTNFELILQSEKISKMFLIYDSYLRIQEPLTSLTEELQDSKRKVRENTQILNGKQENLSSEREILGDQKTIVQEKEEEKDELLEKAENRESQYQQNLNTTLRNIKKLDAEIRSYESTLEFLRDDSRLPEQGSSVLQWPLDYVLITQRFGKTVSSERLYVSGSHSGMDFRAAIGTPVYAVANGTVKGIGDTDGTCPRASFGKWVFIEHGGIGLSTTYGHLSAFKVRAGDRVKAGDLIAYSGNTGRSTAPHLHLTVYATEGVNGEEGVRITSLNSAACIGKVYRMPLAPTAAYLDPLDYFPETGIDMFKNPAVAR